ncbi:filamentous hemagglutinin family protein [Azospirillum lipoferum]|uniref:Filamentous hemagglutinin N-terminal domain-containing protein n=2 Tax=Azospirillum lipoferum TaxID=193 RepID=A0A5A9G9C7_AZOLI|nr:MULTISPECIES: filamentous hemagglutinin N-terminal domain-containing protein [Azospirillum]KAA0590395.1 filamentous hemagglutinin N-terminal domain-containing protein [Azospirillum lipoferum]MCP1614811.1 filamentous hemagglutinin family protein [Azospirillum lipoferum]MDW5532266.1 filamentous hemagglutinin N-terminal domain-containing protein [Azospirillum sp. NL1]
MPPLCRYALVMTAFCAFQARADILTDGSVGPALHLSGPTMVISEELGTRKGNNLFHSFNKFEVGEGQSARFRGSPDIRRVITRVSGGESTKIFGNVSSEIDGSDLIMINPNGFVMGPNAAINVTGSFHASTATEIQFPDGKTFSARSTSSPALSMAEPSAFGFTGPAASIEITGGGISAGRNLELLGGDIHVRQGAIISGTAGGRVRVGAVGSANTRVSAAPISVKAPSAGTVTITDGSQIKGGYGSVVVEGGTVAVEGASVSIASTAQQASGGIDVSAGALKVSRSSGRIGQITSQTSSAKSGGAINIRATDIVLDGGWIAGETNSAAAGASLVVKADKDLTISSGGSIAANTYSAGNAGTVTVDARSIFLEGRGGIGGVTYGAGNGASVSVTAGERLSIIGDMPIDSPFAAQSGVFALSRAAALGDGGRVRVQAKELLLDSNGQIGSGAFGKGGAGSVEIIAGSLSLSNGGTIGSSAGENALRAGSVTISGGEMRVDRGGEVTVRSLSSHDAGSLQVFLTGGLTVNGMVNATSASGAGGNIHIASGGIVYVQGGAVTASAAAGGDGGNLVFGARSIVLNDAQVTAKAVGGTGGSILIDSNTYHVSTGSLVSVSSTFGMDGRVQVNTPSFGQFAPSGGIAPVKELPAAPVLPPCDRAGRVHAVVDQASLLVAGPAIRLPTAFPLPGDIQEAGSGSRTSVSCDNGNMTW